MIVSAAIGFAAACLASLILTPLVRKVAVKAGLTDWPDSHRKLHGRPIPLGGGLVVLVATCLVLGLVVIMPNPWNLRLQQDWLDVLGFLGAATVIVTVGLIDDYRGLRGRQKLAGQALAAGLLMATGLVIDRVGLFGTVVDLGLLAYPLTLVWLLAATNAINLLDGLDGLAATVGIILSLTIAALAAMTGHPAVGFVAVVFAGSLVGFLRFNFPPASIFLGDAGSMLIGLMVGAMAIRASLKGAGTLLLAAPLAVLAVPLFDSVAAILRRKLSGRSIYTTDRGHLHHRLLERLGTNRKVLAFVSVCCVVTAVGALASVAAHSDTIALTCCVGLLLVFLATGIFGRGEFLLLVNRCRDIGLSLVQPAGANRAKARQSAVRLQGSRPWDLLWTTLTESAEKLHLGKIHLDLNLPAAQEGYSATWEQPSRDDLERCWRLDMPLVIAGQPVGRLMIVGQQNGESACEDIEQLLDLIHECETHMRLLLSDPPTGSTPQAVTVGHGGNGEGDGQPG